MQICFLEKIASSNIWNRYNSNSGSESYFHLCIDFLHWQNHHLDLRAMALLSHISWSQSLCVHWTISILKCGSPRATSALQYLQKHTETKTYFKEKKSFFISPLVPIALSSLSSRSYRVQTDWARLTSHCKISALFRQISLVCLGCQERDWYTLWECISWLDMQEWERNTSISQWIRKY